VDKQSLYHFGLFRLSSGRKHLRKSPGISGMHGESGFLRAPARIKVQPSAVKEDRRLQMTPIPEPIGVFLIVWIFELSPSLVALVIRWSK